MYRVACMVLPALVASASSVEAGPPADALHFFEGRTEITSVVKVAMKRPYRSHTVGRGNILSDGSLSLTQIVQEEGKAPHQRIWRIRQVGPGRFTGTMSEAMGPVTVEQVGAKYRFRFKMKGNLVVEQWVAPSRGWMTASTKTTVRKYGMRVATSDGTIRRL